MMSNSQGDVGGERSKPSDVTRCMRSNLVLVMYLGNATIPNQVSAALNSNFGKIYTACVGDRCAENREEPIGDDD